MDINENEIENDKYEDNEQQQNQKDLYPADDTKKEAQEDKDEYKMKNIKNQKTKKQNGKFIYSAWVMVLLILLFAAVSVGSYSLIKDRLFLQSENIKAYTESHDFINTLTGLTNYLEEYKFQENENNGYYSRYENIESIKYYMNDKDKELSVSNMKDTTASALQGQINESQFYLHIIIDENSNIKIESSLDKKFNRKFINSMDLKSENTEYDNLDILYTIPKNLEEHYDPFINDMQRFSIVSHGILILAIGAVSIIILIIIAFSVPYSAQSRISVCRLFNIMFLEFKILIWLGFALLCIGGISLIDTGYYVTNEMFNIVNIIYNANVYFYLIGIPVTFILYLLIYLSIVYIKYIYYTGFKEGFIKNSITGKIFFCIIRKFIRIFQEIIRIDITKDGNGKLLMVLGINLIILWIIALAGTFGFVLAIVYTIFLFRYLLGLIGKVKFLSDASRQIAEGDFNINLNENMGILSPILKNLNNIKDGFKLAVDKEIKSQRMKTELISNVSHDLKTPLTSIITYVDLLRDENIADQTRKEYIDILDRKSKRLKVLIEDLFQASKVGSGNIELHIENLDVIALFKQTLGELEEKINNSTLEIKTNIPEKKVICELDGKRTYRIFENIMSNILKYSMPNSRVYIDIIENEKEIGFIFKNISAYEMNFDASEITERFTRGDKSRNTEGSGLGLAIAKSLIELQNGDLTITIDGDLFKLHVTFPKAELR